MHTTTILASLGLLATQFACVAARGGNRKLVEVTPLNKTILTPVDPAKSKHFVHFDCGTGSDNASSHLLGTIKALHDDSKSGSPGAKLRARALQARQAMSGPVVIDTVFHIVSTTASAQTVLPTMPIAQIDALNKMYNPVGFSFNLINTTWTTHEGWAVGSGDDMNEMKRQLRQGTYSTLNIYFHSDLEGAILGKCSMPSVTGDPFNAAAAIDPAEYFDDGCSVNSGTMPNGSIFGYSEGMTAVHETGHWLGLFHTFEGYACDGDGDFIADTPAQSDSTDGCPAAQVPDSCPDHAGVDNIHNIMDYSTDACYTGFSPLQVQRMQNMWSLYRAGR